MKKVVALLTVLLTSGCITAGMEEPDIFICVVNVNDESTGLVGNCQHSLTGERRNIEELDLIGMQCVTGKGYAKIKTHHQVLHDELNKKKK